MGLTGELVPEAVHVERLFRATEIEVPNFLGNRVEELLEALLSGGRSALKIGEPEILHPHQHRQRQEHSQETAPQQAALPIGDPGDFLFDFGDLAQASFLGTGPRANDSGLFFYVKTAGAFQPNCPLSHFVHNHHAILQLSNDFRSGPTYARG